MSIEYVMKEAGLEGLDALGRRRLRRAIIARRKMGRFAGRHASVLNALDEVDPLDQLDGLDELGRLRKKIKKVGKKVKKASPALLKFVPGVGTALSIAAAAALAAEAKKKAKKANAAANAKAEKEADAIVSRMKSGSANDAASPSGSSSFLPSGSSSLVPMSSTASFSADEGAASKLVEGEYIPAGEKSEAEKQPTQWFPFISNRNLLLLSAAGGLGLVLAFGRGRRRAA